MMSLSRNVLPICDGASFAEFYNVLQCQGLLHGAIRSFITIVIMAASLKEKDMRNCHYLSVKEFT